MKIYLNHCPSQTVRPRELKFGENVHPPPGVTHYMWRVEGLLSTGLPHLVLNAITQKLFIARYVEH